MLLLLLVDVPAACCACTSKMGVMRSNSTAGITACLPPALFIVTEIYMGLQQTDIATAGAVTCCLLRLRLQDVCHPLQ
jgi:hypothetical protein